mmetsp:Transcript_20286/g.38256  ORF Transcript_20286/g.38256 Transcript_20286/m.38256 type:complete len:334 (-) Transcript_20286:1692-2693(-)
MKSSWPDQEMSGEQEKQEREKERQQKDGIKLANENRPEEDLAELGMKFAPEAINSSLSKQEMSGKQDKQERDNSAATAIHEKLSQVAALSDDDHNAPYEEFPDLEGEQQKRDYNAATNHEQQAANALPVDVAASPVDGLGEANEGLELKEDEQQERDDDDAATNHEQQAVSDALPVDVAASSVDRLGEVEEVLGLKETTSESVAVEEDGAVESSNSNSNRGWRGNTRRLCGGLLLLLLLVGGTTAGIVISRNNNKANPSSASLSTDDNPRDSAASPTSMEEDVAFIATYLNMSRVPTKSPSPTQQPIESPSISPSEFPIAASHLFTTNVRFTL